MTLFDLISWLSTGRVKTPIEKNLRAAERGKTKAQLKLGLCYYNGHGVDPDHVEAMRWFRLAAKQGDPTAEFHLGRAHVNGEGVLRDPEIAYAWLERSAQKEHKSAKEWRSSLAQNMTAEQIREGVALSREIT